MRKAQRIAMLRTGLFNVADMAIMAGVGLIAVFGFRARETDSAATKDNGNIPPR